LNDFLQFNITRYRKYIDAEIDTYEIHDGYINHYQSYKKVTEPFTENAKSPEIKESLAQVDV